MNQIQPRHRLAGHIEGTTLAATLQKIHQHQRRGELAEAHPVRWNGRAWEARVVWSGAPRHRSSKQFRWARIIALTIGAGLAVFALVLLIIKLVAAVAAAVAALVPWIIGGVFVLLAFGPARGATVEVLQRVTIKR